MEPSLIHTLIGNLGISGDFSTKAPHSTVGKQKNTNKGGNQIIINVNGTLAERRRVNGNARVGTYKEGYYAVFLDSGQVYFGKLRRFADGAQFVALKDVYYLQNINDSAILNFDLVKLGSEIHSPQDEMHINVSKILFWQKLQDDGPIVTAILNHKQDS